MIRHEEYQSMLDAAIYELRQARKEIGQRLIAPEMRAILLRARLAATAEILKQVGAY